MRVLVTRPDADAQVTARRLADLGHEAIIAPLITILPTGARLPASPFAAIALTSANAVSALARDVATDDLRATPLFAVGVHTGEAARARGFMDIHTSQGRGEHLLELVRSKVAAPARILYLAGRERKPHFEAGMGRAGYEVVVVEVYQARAAQALPTGTADAMRRKGIDAALHFSRRSAEIFCRLATAAGLIDSAACLSHHCISGDAAAPLVALGARRIAVAVEASEAGLLATLPAG
ncbi:MAG: uroporphyrinogen-III synthase [Methylobacteriaceae bacterium]|nr:uroporphyrinogen-III synthase [Methylobacteriaceae bacterium]MBV9705716.1 uroporphyrinogen-III synthase [Methylobacteriaceae bacterium]